jgi:hypothetical protein
MFGGGVKREGARIVRTIAMRQPANLDADQN